MPLRAAAAKALATFPSTSAIPCLLTHALRERPLQEATLLCQAVWPLPPLQAHAEALAVPLGRLTNLPGDWSNQGEADPRQFPTAISDAASLSGQPPLAGHTPQATQAAGFTS